MVYLLLGSGADPSKRGQVCISMRGKNDVLIKQIEILKIYQKLIYQFS